MTSSVATRPLVLLLVVLLLNAGLAAEKRSDRVDELFRQWDTPQSPGAAVLVMHRGDVVHARGYGMANLEHGVPIGTKTVFDIASVSKQFAAMAIALLEADGRLSLDDNVRKYVPELHDFASRSRSATWCITRAAFATGPARCAWPAGTSRTSSPTIRSCAWPSTSAS